MLAQRLLALTAALPDERAETIDAAWSRLHAGDAAGALQELAEGVGLPSPAIVLAIGAALRDAALIEAALARLDDRPGPDRIFAALALLALGRIDEAETYLAPGADAPEVAGMSQLIGAEIAAARGDAWRFRQAVAAAKRLAPALPRPDDRLGFCEAAVERVTERGLRRLERGDRP